jgi:hypothetical protein
MVVPEAVGLLEAADAADNTDARRSQRRMSKRTMAALVGLVVLGGAALFAAQFALEALVSDAATRLAYQIRDEAAALKRSGSASRIFMHRPKGWPEGVAGDYRIEITETRTSPRPGHRSIGVARNLTEPTWYSTSYHLNYVDVPDDLKVAHRKGEPTIVTLRAENGKIVLAGLE